MSAPSRDQPPQPVAASADDAAADHDRPVRVLVQTRTHLVPGGDRFTDHGTRTTAMEKLICEFVWQRDFDSLRERSWYHGCDFAFDNRECWFLIDHHGPNPEPDPDPPVLWYTWTGTEFIAVRDPLPRRVRRELRHYPFERSKLRYRKYVPGPRPPRQYPSRAAEIRARREHLRSSLAGNLGLLPEHPTFVQEHPEEAAWVKARVPPEAWARLDDPSEIGEEEVGHYIWVAEPPDEGEGHGAFLGYH